MPKVRGQSVRNGTRSDGEIKNFASLESKIVKSVFVFVLSRVLLLFDYNKVLNLWWEDVISLLFTCQHLWKKLISFKNGAKKTFLV